MKKMLQFKHYLLVAVLLLFAWSCENEDDVETARAEMESNIVETAQDTEALSSLVAALLKADENDGTDLVATLSSDGPFTVFAPTNDAFTELLGGLDGFDSLDDFDTEEERDLLAKILLYHVVIGSAVPSASLTDGQMVGTAQGEDVTIDLTDGIFVKDATDDKAEVVLEDVTASNGIVHVIDKVLLPQEVLDALAGDDDDDDDDEEPTKNLVEIVVETEPLSILEAAVIKAGLAETLSGEGPFTVFAPTDDAFVALLGILGDDYNSLDDFDTDEEIDLLRNILLYHVIPAKVLEADLAAGEVGTAFAGNSVEIIEKDGSFVIGDAS
ncbi:MAG: fasciclin domain-containing protein, partial [Bacteroidota bacterium]